MLDWNDTMKESRRARHDQTESVSEIRQPSHERQMIHK